MSRRANLHNLAYALLGTFVSRNNDTGGYWSIGRLRAEADRLGVTSMELDLLGRASVPHSMVGLRVASVYRNWLLDRTAKVIDPKWVASVIIRLNFSPPEGQRLSRDISFFGEPYVCQVRVTSVEGVTRVSEHVGRCAPHDPNREHRSARFNGNSE